MYKCLNIINENYDNRKIIVWGMGMSGINRYMELIASSPDMVNRINGFTDSKSTEKTDRRFCGKEIYTLDEIRTNKDQYAIIITTKVRQYAEEILLLLQQMNIEDHIYTFTTPFKPKYDLTLLENHKDKIDKVYKVLQDERSKDVYMNLLNYRKDLKVSWLSKSVDKGAAQYFDPVVVLSDTEVLVDCGAYYGDTISAFISHQDKYRKIYAFEPDPQLFSIMNSLIETKKYNNVITYQKGVMDIQTTLRFNASAGAGAAISESGNQVIETVCLDDVLLNCGDKISYVKMDIEGVEAQALYGMQQIIKRDKPKLAICIYHKEADLWELPLQILEMNPEYKLYIRHYLENSHCETVCYAI